MYIGGSTGSRSAKPLKDAKPEIPSTSVPNPGRRVGPSAPARDAHDDELRIASQQHVGPRPIFSSVSGRKLSTKTSAFDQLQQQLARLGLAQLEREALLVARVELPVDLHVLRAPRAQRVARGGLDLDHLGAEIREDP
jgi:hypothetical protein